MPKFLMGSIVFLLLLGAGYGLATIQARSIPWDCSDWQAFAHDDRTTAILESLAENRGKTLYCGVDQSDTFTKAETWEAGRDRNERDDTVYFGERGSFRGFIAAQEGWLTDGESGITGISIDRIFEFPREPKKRRRKPPKPNLVYDREYPDSTLSVPEITANPGDPGEAAGPTTGYLINNPNFPDKPDWLPSPRVHKNGFVRAIALPATTSTNQNTAEDNARREYVPPTDARAAELALNGSGDGAYATLEVPRGATEECEALGYTRATRIKWWYRDSNGDGNPDVGVALVGSSPYQYRGFHYIQYTARCVGRQ